MSAATPGKRVNILFLLFAGMALTPVSLLLGQVSVRSSANITVTIRPSKVTMFAGETQAFVATVVGIDDKTVNWAVQEDNGGTITDFGLYTAPKIQGVYHVTAASRGSPQRRAVATVTVLTYCDTPGTPLRP